MFISNDHTQIKKKHKNKTNREKNNGKIKESTIKFNARLVFNKSLFINQAYVFL